ncbi:MAG: TIGR02444 family protein [Gammaproteobacteria bacterium]|nr:TIGR02444 family protein [Pseudomonadales bacterium]MCP5349150.1 TIGR02444 family protein [Pseudomonadales bacterium]
MAETRFWDFSIGYYSRPGVADVCLQLQDERGLDVNLLLLCLWYGQFRGILSTQQLDPLLEFSDSWSANVVTPLRLVRRWIKTVTGIAQPPEAGLLELREQVKKLELQAEQLQQDRLQELLSAERTTSDNTGVEAAEFNLRSYLNRRAIAPDTALEAQLQILLGAFNWPRGSGQRS